MLRKSYQIWTGLFEHVQSVLFSEMSQKAHDKIAGNAETFVSIIQSRANASHNGLERQAATGVRLRVEKNLDMSTAVRVHALHVGHGQLVEVLFGAEAAHARVVEVEE